MEEPIESISYNDYTIELYRDTDVASPRISMDNLGTMACYHRRYNLGDLKVPTCEQVIKICRRDDVISRPIYMYDHSGITIRTHSFACPWDSGQLGMIYVTRKKAREWFGVKRITTKLANMISEMLDEEVQMYDAYLNNRVVYFVVKDSTGKVIESCGDFYPNPRTDKYEQAFHCAEIFINNYINEKNATVNS